MKKNLAHSNTCFVATLLLFITLALPAQAETVSTKSSDGIVVYGETYFGNLSGETPIIALFHMAGGDGRGEYAPLSSWLNENGFRAIAWDLRAGGDRFGMTNRTAAQIETEVSYCDAYPDMQAALKFTSDQANVQSLAVWGSSYSAALVFRLAADHPEKIDAVVAASPASGPPMAECALDEVLDNVTVPVLALRPRREYEFTAAQAEKLIMAGMDFHIVENGVHGSPMLQDERTEYDMSVDRQIVSDWLGKKLVKRKN